MDRALERDEILDDPADHTTFERHRQPWRADELAKLHLRHMVGGRSALAAHDLYDGDAPGAGACFPGGAASKAAAGGAAAGRGGVAAGR